MRDHGEQWRGTPSAKRWIHQCMGSEGCMVKEEGDIRARPRRIAYPILHVDAEEIVERHNERDLSGYMHSYDWASSSTCGIPELLGAKTTTNNAEVNCPECKEILGL